MIRCRIRGTSMYPQLRPDTVVDIFPAATIQRGDIVLARPPGMPGPVLKRVVGLPFEQVKLEGSRVRIDGYLLREPYVDRRAALQPLACPAWTLGPDEYVLLGDARDDSCDSRRLGPLPRSCILGKIP